MGLSQEDFVSGIMANLRPQKNQKNAIIALSHIFKSYPRLKLVLAGDGNCRPELERIVRDCFLDSRSFFWATDRMLKSSSIAANGEAFAHAECSIDRMVEKYEVLYREAFSNREFLSVG